MYDFVSLMLLISNSSMQQPDQKHKTHTVLHWFRRLFEALSHRGGCKQRNARSGQVLH